MTLPWVARSVADFWRDAALKGDVRTADLAAQLAEERARYERLVDRLTTMQRAGFVAREGAGYTDTTAPLPEEVHAAILGRTPGMGSDVGRQLMAFAVQELAAGREAKDVAASIWNGGGE